MSKLRTGHIVEVAFWLILIAFFFAYTFEFDKEIEIYKYGAAMWPRAILLLMALAAIGQLLDQRRNGDASSSNTMAKAHEDSAQETDNTGPAWYVSTLILLAIPFIYMVIPEKVASLMSVTDIAPGEPRIGPVFIIGVMLLMGERRIKRMAMVMPFLYGLLLLFFVKLLYVGLPTGNVRPFYDFGNWVVSLLQ